MFVAQGTVRFFGGPWDGASLQRIESEALPEALFYEKPVIPNQAVVPWAKAPWAEPHWGTEYVVDTRPGLLSPVRREVDSRSAYLRVGKWRFLWKAWV